MLNIILCLLKIIGILILVILGLIVTILLLVLLVPVRYRIWVSYHDKPKGSVQVGWLFRLISLFVTYEETLEYTVKLLGFTILSSEKTKEAEQPVLTETQEPSEQPVLTKTQMPSEKSAVSETPDISHKKATPKSEKRTEEKGTQPKPSLEERIRSKAASVTEKVVSLKQKADSIRRFVKDPANQATFKRIIAQVRSILKHLIPTSLKAEAVLGFDDPAVTGQVLSVCSILYLWYGESIQITPVFDESIIEGDAQVRGRIRLGTLLARMVWILLDKNFRILVKRWRANGGILDG